MKELQSLGLSIELRYEDDRNLPVPNFTYVAEEEEEEEMEPTPAVAEPVAPAWEADFVSLEEDVEAAPEVRMDLDAYARKASEEKDEGNAN